MPPLEEREKRMANIAIHGFGRIGRSLMKVALKRGLFVPVSISDIKDISTLAALFEVDSNYGRWTEEVKVKNNCFVIDGRQIPYFDSMKALPDWRALNVDVVVDCTGRATTRLGAQAHLDAGAKHVLVSAPSKKQDAVTRSYCQVSTSRHSTQKYTRSSVWRVARQMH
jgi:glyceraldehyde 3-phosphate dehydrogenase